MKTEAANELSQMLLDRVKYLRDCATSYAVAYATTDDLSNKEMYTRYTMVAEELSKFHGPLCRAFHSVEALIKVEE